MAAAREKNEKKATLFRKYSRRRSLYWAVHWKALHAVCGEPLGRGHAVQNSLLPSQNYPLNRNFLWLRSFMTVSALRVPLLALLLDWVFPNKVPVCPSVYYHHECCRPGESKPQLAASQSLLQVWVACSAAEPFGTREETAGPNWSEWLRDGGN